MSNPSPTSDPNSNAGAEANGVAPSAAAADTNGHPPSTTGQHIRLPEQLRRPHLDHVSSSHRSLSEALRAVRNREEQETLLEDYEGADVDGGELGMGEIFFPDPYKHLQVYYTIHR